jgi:hypothetical protein
MKRILFSLIAYCVLPIACFAQNWTTVSSSNITDLNQQKLAAGSLCFLGTDQNNVPISFQVGGGGQVLARPFCVAVTNGSSASLLVPNPASTLPANIYYRVWVVDTSTGQVVLKYADVQFTGATFNLDSYIPIGGPTPPPFVPIGATLSCVNDTNFTCTVTGSGTILNLGFTGQLAVSRGGTGDSTLAAHSVLVGEGTSAVAAVGPGTAGFCLTSNGASSDPSYQDCPTLPAASSYSGTANQTITVFNVGASDQLYVFLADMSVTAISGTTTYKVNWTDRAGNSQSSPLTVSAAGDFLLEAVAIAAKASTSITFQVTVNSGTITYNGFYRLLSLN